MALRNILTEGDPKLRKQSRPVTKFDARLAQLLDDMIETMREYDGAGLAAPQVGILKRLAVVECEDVVYELINPEITLAEGEQMIYEGCLSVPGKNCYVKRPQHIIVNSYDRKGEKVVFDVSELPAIVMSHEIDHLDGTLMVDKAEELSEQESEALEQANMIRYGWASEDEAQSEEPEE